MIARIQPHQKFETRDAWGRPNGFLVPIYNANDRFVLEAHRPEQAYLTVVAPHSLKGPHLHHRRWGLLTCIKGNVRIVLRSGEGFEHAVSGEDHDYASVQVPAGVAAALVNDGDVDAYVINLPAPAWTAADPDQDEVLFPEEVLHLKGTVPHASSRPAR